MHLKNLFLLLTLFLSTAAQAQIVHIPDSSFKAALLIHGYNITGPNISTIDINNDGEIQVTEAQTYSGRIEVSNLNISDLTGIQAFTALTELYCMSNQLDSLDLSQNTALIHLYCNNNQLSSLDLSQNTALTLLICNSNQLDSLDLSQNTALTRLYFSHNQLDRLNLSQNTALIRLNCSHNQLASLDVSNNSVLEVLFCFNNQFASLDVSNNSALRLLYCDNTQLASLNISNNSALESLSCQNNQLNSLDLSNHSALTYLNCRNNYPFLQICVPSITTALAQQNWYKDASTTYVENCQYPLAVSGKVALDSNANCLVDNLEQGLANALILFSNTTDSSYAITNALGSYQAHLDTGSYTASLVYQHPYFTACPPNQNINIDSTYLLQTVDFALQASTLCPYLKVDISTPILRRCFPSSYYVNYSNTGSTTAPNAYVEVELDSNLYYSSSSIPLAQQQGNLYRFNLGNLPPNSTGQFSIHVVVSCFSQLGQIHCAKAHIYPDSLCLTSLPNIQITDSCLVDTVLFQVTNLADAALLPYLLLEDSVVVDTGTLSLVMGQTTSILYPTNGNMASYQLVLANGNTTHYTATALRSCHPQTASTTLMHLPHLPQDFADIDCSPNRGSYDPNDKTGYPLGYGSQHYISPNSTLDYRIRFQNTGTDTAIFIHVLDTISPYLDLSTLTIGTVSHPYNLTMMPNTPTGEQVLHFEFNPIYLPDSNVNEPASHGFIHYSIAQVPNLPNGTMINNSASIYFDYNAPIKTNTTLHTVCDNCLPHNTNTVVIPSNQSLIYQTLVQPNPFSQQTQIHLLGYTGSPQYLQLEVYDPMGRLQQSIHAQNQALFKLQRAKMPAGIYYFRILDHQQLLQTGRLVIMNE